MTISLGALAERFNCKLLGDPAIEELFSLTLAIGTHNVSVLIAPRDPRKHRLVATSSMPAWTAELYRKLELAFAPYVRPE